MDAATADRDLGPIVYQDEDFVVRVKRAPDEISVYTHDKRNGKEWIPGGYMMGWNALLLTKHQS